MDKLIKVKVRTESRKNSVIKVKEDEFIVETMHKPRQGDANRSVISLIADYFKIPPSYVRIIKGHTSPSKIISLKI